MCIRDSLKQIGDEAFSGCKNLALQSLPVDLTQIGVYAFSDVYKRQLLYGSTDLRL